MSTIFDRDKRYSLAGLLTKAASRSASWAPAWRKGASRKSYDVVIVGGGGHGLATAYYLAKNHGITNVLVIEKGWIGGGNTARNTTIIRSDYFLEASGRFKEFSLKLWEGLSQELNFNQMVSQRGYVDLAHSDGDLEMYTARANAMRLRGVEASVLNREELQKRVPQINLENDMRYPITGALVQERGGTARHDAVAWGYARAASALGVDILEQSEVTGFGTAGDKIESVITVDGEFQAGAVAISAAGHSSEVARLAGIELPLESIAIQAFVTEPLKPVLDTVVSFNMFPFCYLSQTDKGEIVIGGTTEAYNSYASRGSFSRIEEATARCIAMFPFLSKLRLMRQWGGIVDTPIDGNAILGKSPIDNLYLNAGWSYSGFKATPAAGWTLADTIANDKPHPLLAPFSLERYETGALLDDAGAGPHPYAH